MNQGERLTLLELSRERDIWLARLLAAEQAGYARGAASMADEYERGYADGVASFKRIQHQLQQIFARNAEGQRARWGRGGRSHFADPRPGDYPGARQAAP